MNLELLSNNKLQMYNFVKKIFCILKYYLSFTKIAYILLECIYKLYKYI